MKFWILVSLVLPRNAVILFIQELLVILVESISPPQIITGTKSIKCLCLFLNVFKKDNLQIPRTFTLKYPKLEQGKTIWIKLSTIWHV